MLSLADRAFVGFAVWQAATAMGPTYCGGCAPTRCCPVSVVWRMVRT